MAAADGGCWPWWRRSVDGRVSWKRRRIISSLLRCAAEAHVGAGAAGRDGLARNRAAHSRGIASRLLLDGEGSITNKNETLSAILELGHPLKAMAGEKLYLQGSPARLLFYVRSGSVVSRISSMAGREAMFLALSAGEFLPLAILGDEVSTYNADAMAHDNCELVAIEVGKVRKLISSNLRASNYFLEISAGRIERLLAQFTDAALLPSSARVAKWLLDMALDQHAGLHDGMSISVGLSTRNIGLSLAGIARETVSRQLSLLVRERTISRSQKTIKLLSIARLRAHSVGASGADAKKYFELL